MAEVAKALGVDVAEVEARASTSCTSSTRCSATAAAGCGITFPEIYEMQVRAIIEAAVEVAEDDGRDGAARDHDPAGRHGAASSS